MKPINLDELFSQGLQVWMQEQQEQGTSALAMEAAVPDLYLEWLEAPNDALEGMSPTEWVDQLPDAQAKMQLLGDYLSQGIPVPDLLLESLADDADAGPLLQEWLESPPSDEALMMTINLLGEREEIPAEVYLGWVCRAQPGDEIAQAACEQLALRAEDFAQMVLERYANATPTGQIMLCDILRRCEPADEIYDILTDAFRVNPSPLLASYLGYYGDTRALDALHEAHAHVDDYIAYVEIAGAIEALGGTPRAQRTFDGDADYEALKDMP